MVIAIGDARMPTPLIKSSVSVSQGNLDQFQVPTGARCNSHAEQMEPL